MIGRSQGWLIYGQAGDIPTVGHWTSSGKIDVGVFRGGMWILDVNGNEQIDLGHGDAAFWLGNAQYTPLVVR